MLNEINTIKVICQFLELTSRFFSVCFTCSHFHLLLKRCFIVFYRLSNIITIDSCFCNCPFNISEKFQVFLCYLCILITMRCQDLRLHAIVPIHYLLWCPFEWGYFFRSRAKASILLKAACPFKEKTKTVSRRTVT